MTDINSSAKSGKRSSNTGASGKRQPLGSAVAQGANPLFLREEELRRGIELLFFAYRDFTSEPDAILDELGLGRAHHRVIYFVGRYPGMPVSELLAVLKITKQSLSRVLGQLVREGYIQQDKGVEDKRQRLLTLTEKGEDLESRLTANQRMRIARAFREAGAESVDGFAKVMTGMISDPVDRKRFKSADAKRTRGPFGKK